MGEEGEGKEKQENVKGGEMIKKKSGGGEEGKEGETGRKAVGRSK